MSSTLWLTWTLGGTVLGRFSVQLWLMPIYICLAYILLMYWILKITSIALLVLYFWKKLPKFVLKGILYFRFPYVNFLSISSWKIHSPVIWHIITRAHQLLTVTATLLLCDFILQPICNVFNHFLTIYALEIMTAIFAWFILYIFTLLPAIH